MVSPGDPTHSTLSALWIWLLPSAHSMDLVLQSLLPWNASLVRTKFHLFPMVMAMKQLPGDSGQAELRPPLSQLMAPKLQGQPISLQLPRTFIVETQNGKSRTSASIPMSTEVEIRSTPSLRTGISPPLSPPCPKQYLPCSSWTLLSLYPGYSNSIPFGAMCLHFGNRRGDLIIVHFGNHSLPVKQGWAIAVRRRTVSFPYSPQQFQYKFTQSVFMFKALKM